MVTYGVTAASAVTAVAPGKARDRCRRRRPASESAASEVGNGQQQQSFLPRKEGRKEDRKGQGQRKRSEEASKDGEGALRILRVRAMRGLEEGGGGD